jgi:hypothetical protein
VRAHVDSCRNRQCIASGLPLRVINAVYEGEPSEDFVKKHPVLDCDEVAVGEESALKTMHYDLLDPTKMHSPSEIFVRRVA